MCMKAHCATCSKFKGSRSGCKRVKANNLVDKVTWWGCGNHIPSVMDSIPESERCACTPQVERDGKKYPPKAAKAD